MNKIFCFLCKREIDPEHEIYQTIPVSENDEVRQEIVCTKCAEKAKYDKDDNFYGTLVLDDPNIEKNEEKL